MDIIEKKFCAVHVMVKNESKFLPLWLKYYSQFGIKNLYILDHESNDGSTDNLECNVEIIKNNKVHDNYWMISNVLRKHKELLNEYEYVIAVDVDEFLIPNPDIYENLYYYVENMKKNNIDIVNCVGYEVVHQRKIELNKLNWKEPILVDQRKYWININTYNKPLISNRIINWSLGKHHEIGQYSNVDPNLILCHLHRVDFEFTKNKNIDKRKFDTTNSNLLSNPNLWIDKKFENYFDNPQHIIFGALKGELTTIPEKYKGII